MPSVWPDMAVRLCQFHVIQAILRFSTDSSGDADRPPSISRKERKKILAAFRLLQRCRDPTKWEQSVQRFEQDVTLFMQQRSPGPILQYFRKNWYIPFWRGMCHCNSEFSELMIPDMWTDIGLPTGRNRDDMLNTNNWVERAFKTFDTVFLNCRANKM